MKYTDAIAYKQLQTKSDHYTEFLPIAKEIETLARGGRYLKPNDYLLIRDDEDRSITRKRVEKFCPENYLGAAIRLQRVNQKSGTLEVKVDSLPASDNFTFDDWEVFLTKVDKSNNNLKDFVLDVFENALINKYTYVQVDLPQLEIPEDINLAQFENIDLSDRKPYYFIIPIQSVMSEKSEGNSVEWIKYKRLVAINNPLASTKYNMQYILVDNEHISIWQFDDVIVNDEGDIAKIWDQSLANGRGDYRSIEPDDDTAEPISIPHLRGKCPVIRYEIADSLYMADQVKDAQRIIYGLSMNTLHTAANAGFVQKWGRPFMLGGTGAGQNSANRAGGGVSYIPLPKEALAEIVQKYAESLGDESILMMEFFTFEELKGDSINMLRGLIDTLKQYIYTTISTNTQRFEDELRNESGEAKKVDFHIKNLALRDHGSTLIEFTKTLLEHTARALGFFDFESLDGINVSGMDRFDVQPISEALSLAERVFALPKDAIPKPVFVEVLTQLTRVIIENANYEYKNLLNDAIIEKVEYYTTTVDTLQEGQDSINS